jgi:hypothetical protein
MPERAGGGEGPDRHAHQGSARTGIVNSILNDIGAAIAALVAPAPNISTGMLSGNARTGMVSGYTSTSSNGPPRRSTLGCGANVDRQGVFRAKMFAYYVRPRPRNARSATKCQP